MSEPAYPGGNPSRYDGRIADGLSKREWFAGMALLRGIHGGTAEEMAQNCLAVADAMLAASKEPKP